MNIGIPIGIIEVST